MSEKQAAIKEMRSTLTDMKTAKQKHDEELRSCAQLVDQKQKMLKDCTNEKQQAEVKIGAIRDLLAASEANLNKIQTKMDDSPALQKHQELREEYLEIRSKLQTENAAIERQMCKLESQMQTQLQQQSNSMAEVKKLEGQIEA